MNQRLALSVPCFALRTPRCERHFLRLRRCGDRGRLCVGDLACGGCVGLGNTRGGRCAVRSKSVAGRLKLVDLLGLAPLGILKPPLGQLQSVLSLPQPRDVLARLRGCTLLLKNRFLTHPLQLRLGGGSPARRERSLVERVARRLRVEFLPSELVHVGRAKFIVCKHPVRLVQDHEGVRRARVIALVRVHVQAGLAEGSGDCCLAPLL